MGISNERTIRLHLINSGLALKDQGQDVKMDELGHCVKLLLTKGACWNGDGFTAGP
jgi:hypothetical protein